MTVKDLTEKYENGSISIVDDNTKDEALVCKAGSPILSYIENIDVISWQAKTSHSVPKIQIVCSL